MFIMIFDAIHKTRTIKAANASIIMKALTVIEPCCLYQYKLHILILHLQEQVEQLNTFLLTTLPLIRQTHHQNLSKIELKGLG